MDAFPASRAGFPLELARARAGGQHEGQAQLARNGLLLAAVLVPAAAGLWMIADALVPLFAGAPYREVTAAILPASILAGAALSPQEGGRRRARDRVQALSDRSQASAWLTIVSRSA